jgi:hypothetical protein
MQPIVIQPKNSSEQKFISELLGKLGIRSTALSEELAEDIGLGLLMREANTAERVDEAEVLRKLKGK